MTNQLSQFMQQENILTELEHLRTLSALGPGGLTKERAGFEVRDVHPSHYGRLCPIQTPEGPNIGLILRLSTYARINDFGMIETPYVKVKNGTITKEIVYLNALEEENFDIAHAATPYDEDGKITEETVEVRQNGKPTVVASRRRGLYRRRHEPSFLYRDFDDSVPQSRRRRRALMGSNMQKQATPCLIPEAPLVATGVEASAAEDTRRVILAPEEGTITKVDASSITFKPAKGKEKVYD